MQRLHGLCQKYFRQLPGGEDSRPLYFFAADGNEKSAPHQSRSLLNRLVVAMMALDVPHRYCRNSGLPTRAYMAVVSEAAAED